MSGPPRRGRPTAGASRAVGFVVRSADVQVSVYSEIPSNGVRLAVALQPYWEIHGVYAVAPPGCNDFVDEGRSTVPREKRKLQIVAERSRKKYSTYLCETSAWVVFLLFVLVQAAGADIQECQARGWRFHLLCHIGFIRDSRGIEVIIVL